MVQKDASKRGGGGGPTWRQVSLNKLKFQTQRGAGQAFGGRWEARSAFPHPFSSPQPKKRNRPHPTPSNPAARPPSPAARAPPRPGSQRLGDANTSFSAQQRVTRRPSARRGPPAAQAGTSVFTRGGPARAAAARRRRGGGVARAPAGPRGEKDTGRRRGGPRRSRRLRGEPAGAGGCDSSAPAKQCAACGRAQLAGGGGGAPSPPETAPLTFSPRRPLGPSAQLLAPQLAGAGPSCGAGPPLRRCCLLPHPQPRRMRTAPGGV